MDERSAKLAENETIFRAGNESIDKAAGDKLERAPFMCECGDEHCFERIELTPAAYEAVRSVATNFIVVPGHEDPDIEHIALQNERFRVVEKEGRAAREAEEGDPRET